MKEKEKADSGHDKEGRIELIPARYDSNSTLEIEIKDRAVKAIKIDLQSE